MIEARSKARFPLVEMARYRQCGRRSDLAAGVGQTVNVSSSGMLLRVQHELQIGDRVAVAVNLPVHDQSATVQLTALGHVVRIEPGCIALQFEEQHLRRTTDPSEAGVRLAELDLEIRNSDAKAGEHEETPPARRFP